MPVGLRNRFVWVVLALFMLSFVAATNAPSIAKQPQSATVLVGTPAVFVVEGVGEDLTYQWMRNGKDIDGAVGPQFVVPVAQLSDTSSFEVKVTNDKGTVVSCKAMLNVIESGTPSTSPPICPAPSDNGGGGGCNGGGGGGGGGESTSSSSSSGAPGDPNQAALPEGFQPYPVTRWKGSIKVTTSFALGDTSYTLVIEGSDVTFQSDAGEIGIHPRTITTVEGNLTLTRDGKSGDCADSVRASAQVKPWDGQLAFTPDPEPPQKATQLKYHGAGSSSFQGTQTRNCSSGGSTTDNNWIDRPSWLLTRPDETTSLDLITIDGTYVVESTGTKTTYEWHLVKQR